MPKDSISNNSSQLLQNDAGINFEVTTDGQSSGNPLDIQGNTVTPGQKYAADDVDHESQKREQAEFKLQSIVQDIDKKATNPYYTAGSVIRNMVDSLGKAIYGDVTDPEENKRKENELRKSLLLELNEEIRLNPSLAELYERREALNDELGNHEAATRDFGSIVSIKGNHHKEDRRKTVKKSYEEDQINYEEALLGFDRIIAIDPELHWVHQDKATVLMDMGEHEAALKEYDLEISNNPYYNSHNGYTVGKVGRLTYNIYTSSADLYVEIGKKGNSLDLYDELLKRDPESTTLLGLKANLCRDLGKYEDALLEDKKGYELGYFGLAINMAKTYQELGRYEEALSICNEATQRGNDEFKSDVYLEKFKINLRLGNSKDALYDMHEHIRHSSDFKKSEYFAYYGALPVASLAIGAMIIMEVKERQKNNDRLNRIDKIDRAIEDFDLRLEKALHEYHADNQDSPKLVFIMPLLEPILGRNIRDRGGYLNILKEVKPTLEIWEDHLHHLPISNQIASVNQDGCVNQPLTVWNEISAIASIEEASTVTEKMEGFKHLLVLGHIKEYVSQTFNARGVEVEAENVLLREVHKMINAAGDIQTEWLGVPKNIAYAGSVREWATTERIQDFYEYIKEKVLDKTPFELAEELSKSVHCDIFGDITFPKELLVLDKEYNTQRGELSEQYEDDREELLVLDQEYKTQRDELLKQTLDEEHKAQKDELLEQYEMDIERNAEKIESLNENFSQISRDNEVKQSHLKTKLISDLTIENITKEFLENESLEVLNARNNSNLSALDLVVFNERTSAIEAFLATEKLEVLNDRSPNDLSALDVAAFYERTSAIETFLETAPLEVLNNRNQHGVTALGIAVINNKPKAIQAFLNSKTIEVVDTRDNTALTISDMDMINESPNSILGNLYIRRKELVEYKSEEKESSIPPSSSVISPLSDSKGEEKNNEGHIVFGR